MAARPPAAVAPELVPVSHGPVIGEVTAFDGPRGLGTVDCGPVGVLPFHCTAITDGSRDVAVGTVVAVQVTHGRLGVLEARTVRPLPGVHVRGASVGGVRAESPSPSQPSPSPSPFAVGTVGEAVSVDEAVTPARDAAPPPPAAPQPPAVPPRSDLTSVVPAVRPRAVPTAAPAAAAVTPVPVPVPVPTGPDDATRILPATPAGAPAAADPGPRPVVEGDEPTRVLHRGGRPVRPARPSSAGDPTPTVGTPRVGR
jgi:hypothetical protein